MTGQLRILILTPTALPDVAGNATTAERWRRSLGALGHRVRVVAANGRGPASLAAEVRSFEPDVFHAHHAFKGGGVLSALEDAGALAGSTVVVSLAGTDVHDDLHRADRRDVVVEALERADTIVAQAGSAAQRLLEVLPQFADRVLLVPKAFAWLGDDPWDLRAAAGCGEDDVLFFLPAGIRPVKGNLECLRALVEGHRHSSRIRAVFTGPALDARYAAAFAREIEGVEFARWLPSIAPHRMQSAYRGADVVLNASRAEGLPNALLEALAAGRPVLATDIPANRWALADGNGTGPAGLLYPAGDPDELARQAVRLADDPTLRASLGRAGLARAARLPTPAEEAEALVAAYTRARMTIAPPYTEKAASITASPKVG